ncbi:hypothetical protein TCAL_10448 [Tigriopus californicus]|uniref:IRS-type PTB domain-containing protein n=1 Tax=Tigriopus californicus TaxID=6832 RepID=A0A553PU64_TIGCA|nr:hypothetical protein TCAL_10448 [Tigriopus californicus]
MLLTFRCVKAQEDSLTLQLWKDKKDWERNPPSKGSIALEEYLGWEAGFTLEKESLTLALVLKGVLIALAFDCRETLMRWQVRLAAQFEEGQHFSAHLVQVPNKSKFPLGQIRIHLQNRRFSLTTGVPPKLLHSWDLVDLRRYGGLENGRFCFEGGSRCGKGEGLHVLRLDDPQELKAKFDLATKGRLEAKRKSLYKTACSSPSIPSCLDGLRQMSLSSDLSSNHDRHESTAALVKDFQSVQGSHMDLHSQRQRSHSRSMNHSLNWSSTEGQSSCDTMSVALSEMTEATTSSGGGQRGQQSPEHLVNRRVLLEQMGIHPDLDGKESRNHCSAPRSTCGTGDLNNPQWTMNPNSSMKAKIQYNSCYSMDRLSTSSHESHSSNGFVTYDTPRSVLNGSRPPSSLRAGSTCSPNLTPKTQRRRTHGSQNPSSSQPLSAELRRVLAATPCGCGNGSGSTRNSGASMASSIGSFGTVSTASSSLDNYDIPRNLGKSQVTSQLYDTPRSLKESAEHGGAEPFGNYDFPQHGALPVFRKQCGCVLKLSNKSGAPFVSDCVHNENTETLDAKAPRIKLTGTGKMPVVDMSEGFLHASSVANNQILQQKHHSQSPVYATVNKGTKAKTIQPNYCNIGPSLGDVVHEQGPLYENTKTILRPKGANHPAATMAAASHNYENTDNFLGIDVAANYVPMFPKASQDCADLPSLPLIPFQPLNYDQLPLPGLPTPFDSINRKLRQLSDSLNPRDDANPGAMFIPTLKSKSIDQLHTFPNEAGPGPGRAQEPNGFVTVPRKTNRLAGGQGNASPAMRRSASVPCKNAENRGSTSSSDSGFSAGSPNGNPGPAVNVDYMLHIDSDHEQLESHSSQDLDETMPPMGLDEEDTKV